MTMKMKDVLVYVTKVDQESAGGGGSLMFASIPFGGFALYQPPVVPVVSVQVLFSHPANVDLRADDVRYLLHRKVAPKIRPRAKAFFVVQADRDERTPTAMWFLGHPDHPWAKGEFSPLGSQSMFLTQDSLEIEQIGQECPTMAVLPPADDSDDWEPECMQCGELDTDPTGPVSPTAHGEELCSDCFDAPDDCIDDSERRAMGYDQCPGCGAWVSDLIPDPTRCPNCRDSMEAGLSRRVTEDSHDE